MAVYLHVAETVIFLGFLVFVRLCYGTADIVSETCTDRYGADLSENFAFQKPAQQSSTTHGGDASRLVDGNRNPYFVNGSCSETDVGTDLTWSVDLQTEIYVTSVTITARADDYWIYSGFFEILATKDSNTWNCANGFLPSNGKTSLACFSPKKTQSITIKLPGSNRRLSLCEVEVYGRPLDFYDNEVNYALGQNAQQISTYGNKFLASRAVDGDRDQNLWHDSCFHTESASFPWWRVDLGITVDVYATTITNRDASSDRTRDFEILVGPSENVMADENVNCAGRHGLVDGEIETFFCFHAIRGRYVAIVSRLTDYFHFCEVSVHGKNIQEQNEECLAPQSLGMESYRIDDSQIQISSQYDARYRGGNSRLNRVADGTGAGSWCTSSSSMNNQWLQVDFLLLTRVTKIKTQGRQDDDQWVKSYTVSYGDNELKFGSYKQNGQNKVFVGNNDRNSIVQHSLSPVIVARFIRIHPQTWHVLVCMRAEFVGCYQECTSPQPLGMENLNILDSQLSASSVANTNCNAEFGRINFYADEHQSSWCSAHGSSDGTQWLQVDFLKLAKVTEIQTQGRETVDQWVLTYTVSYGDDGVNFQVYYQNGQTKVFSGNKDRTSIVRHGLSPAILARFLRIIPQTREGNLIVLRAEFVGCYKAYQYKECTQPLGMANYGIADSQISASTQVGDPYRAQNARIYFRKAGGRLGAWAASGANLWLQVDFLRTVTVTGIQTQGREDHPQWVTTFTVSFGDDGVDFYFHPQNGPAKIFPGNTDRNSIVSNDVSPYIVAHFVRIHPETWDGHMSMRAEFIGLHKECSAGRRQPLGMENFEILDSQISASSVHSLVFRPWFGRLNLNLGAGSWVARFSDINQWLQVDFLGIVTVTEIQTQSRENVGQWVKTYKVSYSFDGIDFHFYQGNREIKVFSGNTDINSIVQNDLSPLIVARFIRIHPQTWHSYISMRAEFIGFPAAVKLIDPEYVSLENRLSASSFLDRRHSPHLGIISDKFNASSWAPAVNEIGQYIQVDLLQLTPILGVALQTAADQPNDYHTSIIMKYSDIEGSWKVKKDYVGKMMVFTTADCCKQFENILLARHVRLHIVGWGRRIGFRFQLFGTKDYKDVGAGIEDGSIKDHQMISSNHPNDPFPSYEGRVNSLGAWCGNTQRKRLFLQVNFLSNFRVHGVVTQGKPTGMVQYVTQYKLSGTMDEVNWTLYKEVGQVKIFPGNVNGECSRKHLVQPFLARSLRFLPTAWEDQPCMRIEVFGVYKGILQVHVRSGNFIGRYGSVLHQRRSIKLNGQEVSKAGDGYNIAVVDYTTGDLISSNLVSADFSIFNDLLTNIGNDSIVVVAAQNVTERLPDKTLYLLESFGAIRLRYSMIYEHQTWILVGFKGSEKVDWITEKHGKTGEEAIRVAASITLNERKIRPVYQQYFKDTSYGSGSDLALAGQHAILLQNVTSKCGTNNDDCQDGLSLAMWMKHDLPKYKKTTTVSMDERYVYEHYSQGFSYIVPIVSKTWHDARAYCLALEADLVAIHSQHTLNFIQDLLDRLGISVIYIGLKRHPDTSIFHWTDGSNIVFSSWRSSEPNSLSEHCGGQVSGGVWNDYLCDFVFRFICQQPIEDRINLMPLGMESETIQDSSVSASSIYDGYHLAHFGRPNTQRNVARSWCPLLSDKEPYLHVDLGRTKSFCAIGTQGRGFLDANDWYPTSYSIKLSNDSLDWVFLKQNGQQKIFRANEDRTSMVINRFQQAVVAQYVRLYVKTWNGLLVCVRMEIYACKTEQEHQDKRNLISNVLPKSITGKTPENCLDLLMSGQSTDGIYMINPDGEGAFSTFCDQTSDGGGWTVFQRRMDGSVSFSRTMNEYKLGFGNLFGEYWLGLENIVKLTRKYRCELRVDLVSFAGETHHAVYSSVMVGDEDNSYRIYFDGGDFLGPGSNGLTPHGRASFVISNGGGWWYKGLDQSATLNGKYYSTYKANSPDGITWWPWKNGFETLKETKMMIRRRKVHDGALGIESSFIVDSLMETNDKNSLAGYGAPAARLHNVKNWWTNEPAYYIMINLVRLRLVTHVATQGGSDFNFVKNFYIQLLDQSGFWVDHREHGVTKIFEGNNERTRVVSSSDIVSNCLKETLPATAIKIYPIACDASCSFRLELYSCETSCSAPLGVESDVIIASEKMTASSTKSGTTPGKGRLFQSIPWCAEHTKPVAYLQIDFLELFSVSFVATQGGVLNGIKSFVTTYSLMYIDTGQKWATYGGRKAKIFRGNTNSDTVVKNAIETPFLAYSIRFVGGTWETFVCLRVEVYGCYPDNPTFIVHTDSAIAGKELRVKGKYRYCQDSLCPGCKKSLCLRVFNEIHRIAAHFLYDCVYHDFEINVQAPVVPGLYKIYMGGNDYSNCNIDPSKSNERLVGSVTVIEHYSNCLDLLLSGHTESGIYSIDPDGNGTFEVYCDQETFGGGWTVIQRRVDGNESFDRLWADYKNGFGQLDKNLWLGNDFIHRLTKIKREVLLEVESKNDDKAFVLYKSFQVEGEDSFYKLRISDYQESVGDCIGGNNGMQFTTRDRDNDKRTSENCAAFRSAGWWYKACTPCSLNGAYDASQYEAKIRFDIWAGNVILNKVQIKLRDQHVVTCNDQYCYYLTKAKKSWFEAVEECRSFNADLVSIRNAVESQWIAEEILSEQVVDKVHLGLEMDTQWTDGSSFGFNNFPNGAATTGCAFMQKDGSWGREDCYTMKRVLCKKGKFCLKGKCFVGGETEMTYNSAHAYCRDIGYNLAKISSATENEYIRGLIRASTLGSSWRNAFIGLRLDSSEFTWNDGTSVVYSDWIAGRPLFIAGNSCVKISLNGWKDCSCDLTEFPLCEKVFDKMPVDCLELMLSGSTRNGIYSIDPDANGPILVYCDQETFGGGWTLLIRRVDGSDSFLLDWESYKKGFGFLDGNFWLGNDFIHRLTKLNQEVLFDLESTIGDSGYALYKSFKVEDESNKYKLTIEEYQNSDVGDAMVGSNGMYFTTKDRDNDLFSTNCAVKKNGGWWHNQCSPGILTATYDFSINSKASRWRPWSLNTYILKSQMKVRGKNVVTCGNQFCYYLTNVKKSWTEAVQECRKFNADLVSIHDEVENQWIVDNILTPRSLAEVYLGLGMENVNEWTDRSTTVDFTKLPTSVDASTCATLQQSGAWAVGSCDRTMSVLCKRGKFCFQGDCYVLGETARSWDDSRSYCQKIGYDLVKISSKEEIEYIQKIFRASTSDSSLPSVYIGLKLIDSNWQWVDGTMLQYSSWKSGRPNDIGPCVAFSNSGTGWGDVVGTSQRNQLCEKGPILKSCDEVMKYGHRETGFYFVNPEGVKSFKVFCDFSIDGGPWTVIQRRVVGNAPLDYHTKTWQQYRDGFSDEASFWLGNKYIHELTKTPRRLKITMHTGFDVFEAVYEDFTVKNEDSEFAIDFGSYSGTAGDSLSRHRGMKFSTVDQDNDLKVPGSCTVGHPGGWWFANCLDSNLNGVFGTETNTDGTLFWRTITEPIVKTEIKIQTYEKVVDFQSHGIIRRENSSLGVKFDANSMEIKMQTSSEQWSTRVLHPGPFLTHVAITWDENSYLRYYENGTLLTKVPSLAGSDRKHTNSSGSLIANPHTVWANRLVLWDTALTEYDVERRYTTKNFTFEDDTYIWLFQNTSRYNWDVSKACTSTDQTGPCGDHTYLRNIGTFVYTEASLPALYNDKAIIESPSLLPIYRCLSFWYHLFGKDIGTLTVYLTRNISVPENINVWSMNATQGNYWRFAEIDLNNVSNIFKIMIEATCGDGFFGDIAVDDVSLTKEKCENECKPSCGAGAICDRSSLRCIFKGYYDYRWALDSSEIITDERNSSQGSTLGNVVLTSGVIDEALELQDDGKIQFGEFLDECSDDWCFPIYTISTWLKYEEKPNHQQLLAFGDIFKIFHDPNMPEEDQLTVEVTFAKWKCTTSFFVPPEVWSHIIVSVAGHKKVSVYLDGHNVISSSSLDCFAHVTSEPDPEALLYAGGLGGVSFAIDDVRLLFDALAVLETTKSYKLLTGEEQTIFIRAQLTSEVWSNDLLQDSSSAHKSLSELVSTKIMATLQDRSGIKNVVVIAFTQGSVVADINLVYTHVHYQDILLLEEALYVNNTFDGLGVNGVEMNSSSVPSYRSSISVSAINSTTLWVNWTHVSSFELNGIFQGYKLFHRETENSSYSQYNETIIYGNHTEVLLTELRPLVNYTMRLLCFTLSGDGLLSESITVVTPEGEVTASPSVLAVNVSSTAIYTNWTALPKATMTYGRLLGYYVFYWKDSDLNSVLNSTTFEDHFLCENLEKWTVYCFNVSGYTSAGIGPAQTQCTRTFEDAPEEPPSNGIVVDTTKSSVEIQWSPPPASSVPGIIRYYNISYRVLNYSDPEPISLTVSDSPTLYKLENISHTYVLLEINISAFTVATGPVYTMYAVTEEGVPIAAPGNASLLNVSSTAVDANWTGLVRPLDHGGVLLGYRIFIWKQSEGKESSYNTTVYAATQFVHLDGLERWTVYCSQIAAFTRIGDGPRSSVMCTRTFEDAAEEPPSNVTIINTTSSTIEVHWSPPPSYSVPGILRQYNLTYRNLNYSDERLVTLQFDSTVTSHTLENLVGLTMYEINITSFTVLPGPWSSLLVITDERVPGISPLNVSLYNISSTSLRMNWPAIPGHLCNGIVLGYRISIWKQSEGNEFSWNITIPSVLVKQIDGLEKWTTYCMQILAFTRIGDGSLSSVECIRTCEDAPEMPPTNLKVSNITWNTLHLSWDAIINSSFIPGIMRSYRVTYRIIDPGFDQSNRSFLVDSRFTSTNITGLQGLTNYQVMVRGVTVSDGPLESIQLQTEEGVPTKPPVAFNTSGTTSTTFSLSWQEILATEKHGIIRGYELTYEKEGTINQTKTLTLGSSALFAFVYQLLPFSFYKITLRGFTSKGNGVKGIIRKLTSEGIPSVAPKSAYGTNFTGPTSIFLGWSPLTTEQLQGTIRGYQVRYKAFSVADEELIGPQEEIVTVANGGLNGIKLTGLSTYTTYIVSVAAMSGGGVGVRSRLLYVATCRCFKILNTNYWNYQPYANISGMNSDRGFFPYLLDMVTLSCCQTCLEHGTSEIDYFKDGQGNPSEKSTDLEVKISISMETDFSFPMYGYKGQTAYSRYYGFAPIVEAVGTVFFTLKPDYSSIQGEALIASIFSIVPFLAIAVIFAVIAGIIMWALESGSNQEEFPPSFTRGAPSGFWWAFITMTTVGYGDTTARTLGGRIFALIWILVGLVICSLLIGTISSAFTSVAIPKGSETLVYGSQVGALQDSPDYKLGVRRNAKMNTYKKYHTLEEVQQSLLTEQVQGILIDAYVADSRNDLFAHSQLMIKKVIDLTSSYGVIMGRDSKKLQKCFRKFWKANAAAKSQFIKDHSTPVKITVIGADEMMEDTYNPQGDQYQISLNSCLILLAVLFPCGLIYEIRRRKRISSKVEPEKAAASNEDLKNEEAAIRNEDLKNEVSETPIDYPSLKQALLLKFTNEFLTLAKLKRSNKPEEA